MWGLLQTAPAATEVPLPSGYGAALLQALLALMAVSILAWVVLRWAARVGFGVPVPGRGLRVLDRVPLDARRAVHLVQVGRRFFLLGVGDGSAPALLAELEAEDLPEALRTPAARAAPTVPFSGVLARMAGRASVADDEED